MKVLAILGSTRKASTNEHILKTIGNRFDDAISFEIFDGIDKLPHFNPELDGEHPPHEVERFRQAIHASDGTIICTPEYVFSLPGSLKNALEWTVSTTVFSQKPVALIVASASGKKAFESLQLIMVTLGSQVSNSSNLLIEGAKGKIDEKGEINDASLIQSIKALVDSFLSMMK